MAAPAFDIRDLFPQFFGFSPNPNFEVSQEYVRKEMSDLGAPYYASVNNKFGGREWFLPVTLNGEQLPLPSARFMLRRRIVKRNFQNVDGTIKTNLGFDDVSIRISGICVGENGAYPEEELTLLNELHALGTEMPISNVVAAIFDVEDVVIEDLKTFEVKGMKGVVPYQMELTSDKKFDLIIKDV